jgi:ribose transport system substrate-binding protein
MRLKICLTAVSIAAMLAATGPSFAEGERIYGVTAAAGDNYMISAQCGAQDAAKALGVDFTWNGVGPFDVNQLLDALNVTIQQNPQAIVLLPISPTAFVAPVKELAAKGVPVATVGPSLSEPVDYYNVNSNNQQGGELLAEYIGQQLGGEGAVAVLGLAPGNNPESPRDTAFIELLNTKYPTLRVLPEEFVFANSAKAAEITTALINANPDLKAIFGTDGPTTIGIVSGVKASGRTDITVLGYDSGPPVLDALRRGDVKAIVSSSPYNMGKLAVEKLVDYLRSGATGPVTVADPHENITEVFLLTAENVDSPEASPYIYSTTCE